MPKKTVPPPQEPNRETAAPGLLMVADLIARIPERKADLVAYEIARRERERALLYEARQRLSWHPVRTIKTLLFYGINGFVLAWAAGLLAILGRSYNTLKAAEFAVPVPFFHDAVLALGQAIPTSTTLIAASRLPAFSFWDAVLIGLAVAATVMLMKLVASFLHRDRLRQLASATAELERELEALKRWAA